MSKSKMTKAFEKLMLSLSPPCAYDDGLDDPENDNDHLLDQTHNSSSVFDERCVLRDDMVRPMSSQTVPSIATIVSNMRTHAM